MFLIVRVPGEPSGQQVDTVVSLVDVIPVLLGRMGLPTPTQARGRDLWPMFGSDLDGAAGIEHTGKQPEAVVTHQYKYIRTFARHAITLGYPMDAGRVELYDADPGQTRDLSREQPEKVAELEVLLGRLKAGERPFTVTHRHVDQDERPQLHELGYVE